MLATQQITETEYKFVVRDHINPEGEKPYRSVELLKNGEPVAMDSDWDANAKDFSLILGMATDRVSN